MVASKGGISYDRALQLTRTETHALSFALALAHGGEIDWDLGKVEPPRVVQDQVRAML